jgi:hypothetical protein
VVSRRAEMINLFFGSILTGALLTFWIVIVDSYIPREEALGYTVIALIVIVSTIIIQKYSAFDTSPWHAFVVVIISLIALIVCGAVQKHELFRLLFLPVGAAISAIINFIVYFVRARNKKAEGSPARKPWLGYIAAGLAVAFILPLLIAVYMRFFLPPKVEPKWVNVEYDYSLKYDWDQIGKRNPGPGLSLDSGITDRGDHRIYDWVVTAYLVTSTSGLWDEGYYVRRARFQDSGSFVTDYGMVKRDFECPRYSCTMFLPYDVIISGKRQGDFKNYKPEPLQEILSSNNNVYFGVELVTVVSGSRGGEASEGTDDIERRIIVPLDARSARYGEEQYLNSNWVSMVSGNAVPVSTQEETGIGEVPPAQDQPREDQEIDRSDWDIF